VAAVAAGVSPAIALGILPGRQMMEILIEKPAYAVGEHLTRIFHAWIEQRSGEGVIRLVSPSQNENTTHRFFWYRL
jgi:hypothetical protein